MTGTASHRPHWLETRVPPPLVALVIGLAMWGCAHLLGSRPGSETRAWISRGLGMVAAVVAAVAIATFRRAGTTLDPHRPDLASALVEGGINRLSRNPMYLAMAIALLAWAVHLGSPWQALGVVGFVAYLTRFQILPEERRLTEKFGARYSAYRQRTRRWL